MDSVRSHASGLLAQHSTAPAASCQSQVLEEPLNLSPDVD